MRSCRQAKSRLQIGPMTNISNPRPQPETRGAYRHFQSITTRWNDNDAYGHVNNVVYYSWFDTVVNTLLIEKGFLNIHRGTTIGLVVETSCNYFAPLAFPETVALGLRVAHLGRSSVRYEIGVFGGNGLMAAKGHFVHAYVNAQTRSPTLLPDNLIHILETLQCI